MEREGKGKWPNINFIHTIFFPPRLQVTVSRAVKCKVVKSLLEISFNEFCFIGSSPSAQSPGISEEGEPMMDKDEEGKKRHDVFCSRWDSWPHCCTSFLFISMISTEMSHSCLDPLLKQVKKDEVLPSTGSFSKSSPSVH